MHWDIVICHLKNHVKIVAGIFAADNVYISVVCDGHGGSSYVRSDIGAQIAADVVVEKNSSFYKKNTEQLV